MKTGAVARYHSGFLILTGVLTGLVLSGLSIGLLLNPRFAEHRFWLNQLTLGCWLLLAGQALLAVVAMVRRLLHRRWTSALGWFLLAGLGVGVCAATMIPVAVIFGGGVSVGEPPPGSPSRIEADRIDSLYESGRLP